jgi:hypothetical protein
MVVNLIGIFPFFLILEIMVFIIINKRVSSSIHCV